MRLLHYTSGSIRKPVESVDQEPRRSRVGKPCGFWVSVEGEDDWPSWCLAERFRLSHLRRAFEVTLTQKASVLHLASVAELDDFTAEYARCAYPEKTLADCRMIDWKLVAERYQGIIIAPYQWTRRLDWQSSFPPQWGRARGWYYGWDCASGCIWDVAAIQRIRRVKIRCRPRS